MTGPRLLSPSASRRVMTAVRQTRQLHITGAATYPSRFLMATKTAPAVPTETPRRFELERPAAAEKPHSTKNSRQFNTSRTLKAVKDSSTIDFAYLPDSSVLFASAAEEIRVPILPGAFFPPRNSKANDEIVSVHRPEISTASADSTHISAPSAMSELSDTGIHMDFDAMTKKAIGAAEKIAAAAGVDQATKEEVVKKAQGMMQQIWTGLLDDVFGHKGAKVPKA